MKFILVSLFIVGLVMATPPEPVVLKPLPDKASSGSRSRRKTDAAFHVFVSVEMAPTTSSTATPGGRR
ncbi:hypothetical protein ACHAP5_011057 [Fusarium lateritium]